MIKEKSTADNREIDLRSKKTEGVKQKGKRDLKKKTIAVLVEEAEGFLELGDLVVGELIRHCF